MKWMFGALIVLHSNYMVVGINSDSVQDTFAILLLHCCFPLCLKVRTVMFSLISVPEYVFLSVMEYEYFCFRIVVIINIISHVPLYLGLIYHDLSTFYSLHFLFSSLNGFSDLIYLVFLWVFFSPFSCLGSISYPILVICPYHLMLYSYISSYNLPIIFFYLKNFIIFYS